MTRQRAIGVLAWCLFALDLAVYSSALMLLSLGRQLDFGTASLVSAFMVFPLMGALIVSLRPQNRIGWIFLALGLGSAITSSSAGLVGYAGMAHLEGVLAVQLYGVLGNVVWPLNIGIGSMLIFLFPDGRLPSPRWRFAFWLDVTAIVLAALSSAVLPGNISDGEPVVANPLGITRLAGLIESVMNLSQGVVVLMILVSLVSLVIRYIRTSNEQRQRIKWFVYGTALMALVILVTVNTVDESSPLSNIGFAAGIVMLPLGAGIGVLRYRLYDIDAVINRTLVYGALTLVLVLIYVVGVVGVQALIGRLTGDFSQQQQPLLIVATTLIVAALFNPLRRRFQGFIDRRFYRTRYDAARTLAQFGAALRNEVELSALSENLVQTVEDAMQPAHASLWLLSSSPSPEGKGAER